MAREDGAINADGAEGALGYKLTTRTRRVELGQQKDHTDLWQLQSRSLRLISNPGKQM